MRSLPTGSSHALSVPVCRAELSPDPACRTTEPMGESGGFLTKKASKRDGERGGRVGARGRQGGTAMADRRVLDVTSPPWRGGQEQKKVSSAGHDASGPPGEKPPLASHPAVNVRLAPSCSRFGLRSEARLAWKRKLTQAAGGPFNAEPAVVVVFCDQQTKASSM